MGEGLNKQVESPHENAELGALKRRIGMLQMLYGVLFGLSLIVLVYQYTDHTHRSSGTTMLWACTLGGAVLVRLIRQGMVNKYNRILMGGQQGPLT